MIIHAPCCCELTATACRAIKSKRMRLQNSFTEEGQPGEGFAAHRAAVLSALDLPESARDQARVLVRSAMGTLVCAANRGALGRRARTRACWQTHGALADGSCCPPSLPSFAMHNNSMRWTSWIHGLCFAPLARTDWRRAGAWQASSRRRRAHPLAPQVARELQLFCEGRHPCFPEVRMPRRAGVCLRAHARVPGADGRQ